MVTDHSCGPAFTNVPGACEQPRSDSSRSSLWFATTRLIALALLGLGGGAAVAPTVGAGQARALSTVSCRDIIADTAFPYSKDGYRLALGVVAVPPGYLRQVVPTRRRPWSYWRKAGLVIRSGTGIVTVSIPMRWRNRVGITWGNEVGIVSSLHSPHAGAPRVSGTPTQVVSTCATDQRVCR